MRLKRAKAFRASPRWAEPPVDAGSWWTRLRASGASPVAARGERERFLFYDGAINLPGPVKVARRDAAGRELLLAVRPFHQYPDAPRSVLDLWGLPEARTLTNLTARPGEDRFASPAAGGKRLIYREWETGFLAWDLETGKKTLLPDTKRVWNAVLSGDGRTAALLRHRKEDPEIYLCVVDVSW
jgi:hypothetical protein